MEIIILGDVKARKGSERVSNIVGSLGEQTLNDNGQKHLETLEVHKLELLNFLKRMKPQMYKTQELVEKWQYNIEFIIYITGIRKKKEKQKAFKKWLNTKNTSDHNSYK